MRKIIMVGILSIIASTFLCMSSTLAYELNTALQNHTIQSTQDYFEFIRKNKRNITDQEILDTADQFLQLNPTINELNHYTRAYGFTADIPLYIKFKAYGFEKIVPRTIEEFFTLIDYALPGGAKPSIIYKQALEKIIHKHLDLFLQIQPENNNIERLLHSYPDLKQEFINRTKESIRLVIESGIVQTAEDFLLFLMKNSKILYNNGIVETVDHFTHLSPTIDEVITFLESYGTDISTHMKLRDYGYSKIQTPKDFIRLSNYHLPWGTIPSREMRNELTTKIGEHIDKFLLLQPNKKDLEDLIHINPELKHIVLERCPKLSIEDSLIQVASMRGKAYKDISSRRTFIDSYPYNKKKYAENLVKRYETFYKNKIDNEIQQTIYKIPSLGWTEQQQILQHLQQSIDDYIKKLKDEIHLALESISEKTLLVDWTIPNKITRPARLQENELPHTRRDNKQKLESKTTCSICWDDDIETVTTHCNHTCCKECYNEHVKNILSSNQFQATCFHRACNEHLIEDDIRKANLEKSLFNKWKQKAFFNKPGNIQCPREECNQYIHISHLDKKKNFLCNFCFLEICCKCHYPAHRGVSCDRANSLRGNIQSKDIDPDKAYNKLKEKKIIQECPKCKAPGVRVSGCSHIICPKQACKYEWTYSGTHRG